MAGLDDIIRAEDDSVVVSVHVQPGAGRSMLVGRHGAAIKLRVAAPPLDGRANDAATALLADTLGVAVAAVSLVAGARSRLKRFRVSGVDAETARARLELALDEAATTSGPRSRRSR